MRMHGSAQWNLTATLFAVTQPPSCSVEPEGNKMYGVWVYPMGTLDIFSNRGGREVRHFIGCNGALFCKTRSVVWHNGEATHNVLCCVNRFVRMRENTG